MAGAALETWIQLPQLTPGLSVCRAWRLWGGSADLLSWGRSVLAVLGPPGLCLSPGLRCLLVSPGALGPCRQRAPELLRGLTPGLQSFPPPLWLPPGASRGEQPPLSPALGRGLSSSPRC